MRSLILSLVLFVALAGAAPGAAATSHTRFLFFDARFTDAGSAGPAANSVRHVQIGSGVLHDADNRVVGTFAFRCTWLKMLRGDDALERCSGHGRTADGRIDVAGPSRRTDQTHSWSITGGTAGYDGARVTGLGQPPVAAARWRALLAARSAQLSLMEQQDGAAMAADVPAFVRTVNASARVYRSVALTSTVFGVPGCVF